MPGVVSSPTDPPTGTPTAWLPCVGRNGIVLEFVLAHAESSTVARVSRQGKCGKAEGAQAWRFVCRCVRLRPLRLHVRYWQARIMRLAVSFL